MINNAISNVLLGQYAKKYNNDPNIVGLITRLMEVRPGGFVIEDGIDAYAAKIRIRGHVYNNPVEVMTAGTPGHCHHACAYVNKKKPRLRIVTGYGYYSGQWYRHTWLLDSKKNRIKDIDTRAETYFGYELSDGEAKVFYDYFYREGVFETVTLKCPKCGLEQPVNADEYATNLQTGGHPYTCTCGDHVKMLPTEPGWGES